MRKLKIAFYAATPTFKIFSWHGQKDRTHLRMCVHTIVGLVPSGILRNCKPRISVIWRSIYPPVIPLLLFWFISWLPSSCLLSSPFKQRWAIFFRIPQSHFTQSAFCLAERGSKLFYLLVVSLVHILPVKKSFLLDSKEEEATDP